MGLRVVIREAALRECLGLIEELAAYMLADVPWTP